MTAMTYVLHYAPDNASLIVRLALDTLGLPYVTKLVDRSKQGQRAPDYLALNPNGLIPTLITPEGPIFETGAILLWLVDRHAALGPAHDNPKRGAFLKWLFFCANTVHARLVVLFYPERLVGDDPALQKALQKGAQATLLTYFQTLNDTGSDVFGQENITVVDLYLAAMLRWSAIYGPKDRSWFCLADYPVLAQLCQRVEALPATTRAKTAEGLGPTPFTAPRRPNPPEGSAL